MLFPALKFRSSKTEDLQNPQWKTMENPRYGNLKKTSGAPRRMPRRTEESIRTLPTGSLSRHLMLMRNKRPEGLGERSPCLRLAL